MAHLILTRPLIIFDVETTGIDPDTDRIVQLGALRLTPQGERSVREWLINPGAPCSAEAEQVHGITAARLADAPRWHEVAQEICAFFADADIGGFNVARFDLPFLRKELGRVGLDLGPHLVIDVMSLYHKMEPRNLQAACKHYLGAPLDDAHDAVVDAKATCDVLGALLGHYEGLPLDVEGLAQFCLPEGAIDPDGKLVRSRDGSVILNISRRHRGKKLTEVDVGFLEWMLTKDFNPVVIDHIVGELKRRRAQRMALGAQ